MGMVFDGRHRPPTARYPPLTIRVVGGGCIKAYIRPPPCPASLLHPTFVGIVSSSSLSHTLHPAIGRVVGPSHVLCRRVQQGTISVRLEFLANI